jgi:threonyl-tRNA synthetase
VGRSRRVRSAPGLAKASVGRQGRRQKLVDTSYAHRPRHANAAEIVTDKHPDALDMLRHSTAHLLAQAVQRLFPGAQVTIGPVIDNGFYYDFAYERQFTVDDLARSRRRCRRSSRKRMPVRAA